MDSISSTVKQQSARELPQAFLPPGKTYPLGNGLVELGVDTEGGHLWPVRFKGVRGWIEPMHRAAWADDENLDGVPPVIKKLSGDFFAATLVKVGPRLPTVASAEAGRTPLRAESTTGN